MQFAIGREISSGVGDGLPPPLSTKGWLIITEVYISFPDIQNEIMKYARRTVRRDKCVFSILILTLLHLTRAGWWTRGILIPVNTSRAGPCIPAVLSILSIVNQVEAAVFLFSTPVMTLDWAELSANWTDLSRGSARHSLALASVRRNLYYLWRLGSQVGARFGILKARVHSTRAANKGSRKFYNHRESPYYGAG